MKLSAFCLLALVPLAALADGGSTVGNGGDVIVCPRPGPGGVPRIEMLDYFEARHHDRRSFPYSRRYAHPQERIDEILAASTRFDSARADRYRAFAVEFLTEAEIEWSSVPLIDIPDSGHELAPASCRLHQLIIRRGADRGSRRQFLVDRSLWSQMDSIQRAAAILHEAALEEMLERAPATLVSRSARFVNGLLGSVELSTMSMLAYINELIHLPPFNTVTVPRPHGEGGRVGLNEFVHDEYGNIALAAGRIGHGDRLPNGNLLVPNGFGMSLPGSALVWLNNPDWTTINWPLTLQKLAEAPPRRIRFGAAILEAIPGVETHPIDAVFEIRQFTARGVTAWRRLPTHALVPPANEWVLRLRPLEHNPETPAEILEPGWYQYRLTLPLAQVVPYMVDAARPPRVCVGIESSQTDAEWEHIPLLPPYRPTGRASDAIQSLSNSHWCSRISRGENGEPSLEDFRVIPAGRGWPVPTRTVRVVGEILQNPDSRIRRRYRPSLTNDFLLSESTIATPGEMTIVE